LSYYIHYTDMDDPQYVHDDVPSNYPCQEMLYNSHHSHTDTPQDVTMM